jgi:Haem-degrading
MKLSLLLSSPIPFGLLLFPVFIYGQDPLALNNYNYIGSTPSQRLYINQTQAQAVISAAVAKNVGFSFSNIAVTDPSGLLVAFLRTDNAFPASIDISIKKARTVSLFQGKYATADLYNASLPSGTLYGKRYPSPRISRVGERGVS